MLSGSFEYRQCNVTKRKRWKLNCRLRPPCVTVGSCNYFFGASSAFNHFMACTLAESPSDPPRRKLRQLRSLRCRFDWYRVERTSSRAGVAPAEVQRLSRRTGTPVETIAFLVATDNSGLPTNRQSSTNNANSLSHRFIRASTGETDQIASEQISAR
jgi:hypothetical protein